MEKCNLHQRIALKALITIGTSPRLLMLGLMLPTMFLSMWISNTATTSMMVPIVEAIVTELDLEIRKSLGDNNPDASKKQENNKQNIRVMLFLAVAYAASCGGVGTLTGTGPNLVLKGMIATTFGSGTPINFASWMAFAMPTVLVNLFLCWLWLQVYFIGFPWQKSAVNVGSSKAIKKMLKQKYVDLGAITFQQVAVLVHFIILVCLWFFREPRFMPGWGDYFVEQEEECGTVKDHQIVDDASSAMLIVFLLFLFPSEPSFWPFTSWSESRSAPALLEWQFVQKRFPWGVSILFGGGFALAAAAGRSGLSDYVGHQLSGLQSLPQWAMVVVICVTVAVLTEVTSNVATANILLPVLAAVGRDTGINPLYLMIPATVTCSYAFMLPVATPPNAIAHEASGMTTTQMMKVGFLMNILCVVVNMVAINTYGVAMFDLNNFPDWANSTGNCTS